MARIVKYETKKGNRYMYIIENGIDPQTGKRSRVVKRGFKKSPDAKAAAVDMEYKLGISNLDVKNTILFKDFAQEWLSVYSLNNKKLSTIKIRKEAILILNHYFSFIPLKKIKKKMYQNFLNDLKSKKKLAYNSILSVHSAARMIFKYAVEQDIIMTNPTQYSFIPKDVKTVQEIENEAIKEKYLEKHELKLFLDKAYDVNKETHAMLFTLAWTGLRIGELAVLKWKDIDFEEKTLSVTKTYFNETNKIVNYILQSPKTKTSIRVIDIEDDVIYVLKKHKSRQNILKLELGKNNYHDEDFVFGRTKHPYYGYPHLVSTMSKKMKRILNKCPDIKKELTPHSLRHTHTSLLAEAGVELIQIMERLGHSSDKTTTQVYLHITKDRKKEASKKFGELMRNL